MLENVVSFIKKLFYFLFSFVFLYVLLADGGSYYSYQTSRIILLTVCALVVLFLIYIGLKSKEAFFIKYERWILGVFLGVLFVIQVACGWILRFTPAFDLDAIYGGAIEWVETGTFSSYYEYFYRFPNNLGGMAFLKIVFQFTRFLGIQNDFMVAVVLNSLLSLAAIFFTCKVCKKLLGVRHEFFALSLFAASLPFYFLAPVFYTDALSMLFPIAAYYFYLRLKESAQAKQLILNGIALGLFAAIGTQIKFSVLIIVIAILIDALFFVPNKKFFALTGISVVTVALCLGLFNHMIYSSHLDKSTADQMNVPVLHWVMMGLKGNGGYNPEDYNFTYSFTDPDERSEAIQEEIQNRITGMGANGLLKHLTLKAGICFGDGTFGLSEFLDDTPAEEGRLSSYLLFSGENYSAYQHLTTGVFWAILIFMICSGLIECFDSRSATASYMAPRLAVFGLLLFLVFWEARSRYIINFIPFIYLSAVFAADPLQGCLRQGYAALKKKRVRSAKK